MVSNCTFNLNKSGQYRELAKWNVINQDISFDELKRKIKRIYALNSHK